MRSTPWGGGNQFLKALNSFLIEQPHESPTVLINSHHIVLSWSLIQSLFSPSSRIIHRVDGPISLVRGYDSFLDTIICLLSSKIADGVVFQSEWSKNSSRKFFSKFIYPRFNRVILNGVDPSIFYPDDQHCMLRSQQITFINTSWSSSQRKGSSLFFKLALHPSLKSCNFVFIGNTASYVASPNLSVLKPMNSIDLSKYLRSANIYVTFSRDDPCSNSLLEAIACGCVPFAIKSGGNTEIVSRCGGYLFNDFDECVRLLQQYFLIDLDPVIAPRYVEQAAFDYLELSSYLHSTKRTNPLLTRIACFLVVFISLKFYNVFCRFKIS